MCRARTYHLDGKGRMGVSGCGQPGDETCYFHLKVEAGILAPSDTEWLRVVRVTLRGSTIFENPDAEHLVTGRITMPLFGREAVALA